MQSIMSVKKANISQNLKHARVSNLFSFPLVVAGGEGEPY